MKLKQIGWWIAVVMVALLWIPNAFAQETTLPPELLNTNVRDWQLNGVTLLIALQVLGRGYAALRNGGGLVGIFKGILFGTNTPKPQ